MRLCCEEEKVAKELSHWDVMPVTRKLEMMSWEKHSKTSHLTQVAVSLGDRCCLNDTFQSIFWTESLWKQKLSDMMCHTHKVCGEPQECQVMARALWGGKINQKKVGTAALLSQCLCHLDAEKCAIGAKAFHLFAQFR